MSSQYVPNFVSEPNRYTVVNATPEDITLRWAGMQFSIPPSDVVGRTPARDADGDKIPGTLVLEDGYCPRADGSYPTSGQYNWFAADAIKKVLGINPDNGAAEGSYARKGISFLPTGATKDMITTIKEAGRRRYDAFQVTWAQQEIGAYRSATEKASRHGLSAPPPDEDYARAILILERANEIMKKQIGSVTDGMEEAADDDELKFRAWALATAEELATEASIAKGVDKATLAEKMVEDPVVMKHLRRKYRIRKIGHLEEPEVVEA